jgi:hypothetical protein
VLLSQINSFSQITGPATVTRKAQRAHKYIRLTAPHLLFPPRNTQQHSIPDTTRRSSKNKEAKSGVSQMFRKHNKVEFGFYTKAKMNKKYN